MFDIKPRQSKKFQNVENIKKGNFDNKAVFQKKEKMPLSSTRKNIGLGVILIAMIGMFVFTDLTSTDIFFWLFFFAMFWYRLDSRISIGGALVGLVVIMFLSAGQGFKWWQADDLMEQIAVGVYFFLVIGVLKQIWEYKTESKVYKPGIRQSGVKSS